MVRVGVGPTRDPCKHLFFFLLCLFCLFFFVLQEKTSFLSLILLCYVAAQCSKEGDGSAALITFFFLFWSCVAAQRSEEGDDSNAIVTFFFLF